MNLRCQPWILVGMHNLGSSQALSSSNNFSMSVFDKFVQPVDLKLNLQLYKVGVLLPSENLQASKREVKVAIIARGDSSRAILLRHSSNMLAGTTTKQLNF